MAIFFKGQASLCLQTLCKLRWITFVFWCGARGATELSNVPKPTSQSNNLTDNTLSATHKVKPCGNIVLGGQDLFGSRLKMKRVKHEKS